MSSSKSYLSIRIPASSANLGGGFDTLGLALNLYNSFHITPYNEFEITFSGFGDDDLRTPKRNLLISTYEDICQKYNRKPTPFKLYSENNIPLDGGLGSSATAILAGIIAARQLNNLPLSRELILEDALEAENHPDNIGASLYGGFTIGIICDEKKPHICKVDIPSSLKCLIVYPKYKVSTIEARRSIPEMLPLADVIYSLSRVALFTAGMLRNDYGCFFEAMKDRIHEPYRINQDYDFPGLKVKLAGDDFYGFAISGSGPSILILCSEKNGYLMEIIKEHFKERQIKIQIFPLEIDNKGVLCHWHEKELLCS